MADKFLNQDGLRVLWEEILKRLLTKADKEDLNLYLKSADLTEILDSYVLDSELASELSKYVAREIQSANGNALIFNESDGGGAKWEGNNGINAFVGVNDATNSENGRYVSIYVKDSNEDAPNNGIVRIGMNENGAYYVKGSGEMKPEDEIVTKKDIAALTGATQFRGVVEIPVDEDGNSGSVEDALASVENPSNGDIVIVGTSEYIYADGEWKLLGDEGVYATKADVEAIQDQIDKLSADLETVDGKADKNATDIILIKEKLEELDTAIASKDPLSLTREDILGIIDEVENPEEKG